MMESVSRHGQCSRDSESETTALKKQCSRLANTPAADYQGLPICELTIREKQRTLIRSQSHGDLKMTRITATEARKQLYTLADSHEPIQIAGKRHSAVLVSGEDWRAIQETLYLTSTPVLRESIVKGIKTPVDKCNTKLDW